MCCSIYSKLIIFHLYLTARTWHFSLPRVLSMRRFGFSCILGGGILWGGYIYIYVGIAGYRFSPCLSSEAFAGMCYLIAVVPLTRRKPRKQWLDEYMQVKSTRTRRALSWGGCMKLLLKQAVVEKAG
ncbi:hypothetical protein QBC42DRAFT_38416 [Cladorrhinum samala]|uniref:Uncharacterized protein n=1 Tax=Cladorrhinum samala TaxID=585594 RepID=A0AAV9H8T9_9PEZI|nr:hypothetical protein QBC42DRAFT_38416 [Cladorrhinum samala]